MRSQHSVHYRRLLVRLRRAREQAGLTQGDVARAVGRPQSYVSKCESGERRLDALELLDLARLYGHPLGFFVGETDAKRAGASLSIESAEPYPRRPRAAPKRRKRGSR